MSLQIQTIALPLISQEKDSCGIKTWIASYDARPQDGPQETIEIVDHSELTCRVLIPSDEVTQVRYTYLIESRKTQNLFESYFWGPVLESSL